MIGVLMSEDRAIAGKQPERRHGITRGWVVASAAAFPHFKGCVVYIPV